MHTTARSSTKQSGAADAHGTPAKFADALSKLACTNHLRFTPLQAVLCQLCTATSAGSELTLCNISPLCTQAGLVEEVWKILVNMGLHRTEQGAMLLTVHGSPEEMHPEDLSKMHLTDFARLYSVKHAKHVITLLSSCAHHKLRPMRHIVGRSDTLHFTTLPSAYYIFCLRVSLQAEGKKYRMHALHTLQSCE